MFLRDLVKGLKVLDVKGNLDIDISDIAYDSRKVKKGSLFVCIDGMTTDGHKYIPSALENGAAALLVQKDVTVEDGVTVVKIEDTRFGLAFVSDAFFGHPSQKLHLIGVTGTKGKTTTTYMIKSILEHSGQKVGLVGTIANMIGDEVLYAQRTTPESYDLQSLFEEMLEKGVTSATMEVSSQGLALDRVGCCDFDIGIFTNITSDHIGPREHKDFDDYLEAKAKLFRMCKKGVINIDDPHAQRIMEKAECEITTFGIEKDADIKAYDVVKHSTGVDFKITSPWGNEPISVSIPGKFNVYNALAAIGACALSGISMESIKAGLANVKVKGRAEVVETGRDFTVMIDYAHNAISLENILTTIKDYASGRVVCLFGCGGDRDKARRFEMGEVSGRLADFTIITSDNPRTEDPDAIINDIETGIKRTTGKYIKITERREAIKYAIDNAQPKDIILLAGKGHETYQEFKDKTIHFDEREVVAEILEKKQAAGC